MLRNDDGRTGGDADKKADQQIDDGGRGTSNGSKRFFADKVADNNGVCRIIKLLKKSPEKYREKEDKELFPDDAFGNLVGHLLPGYRSLCFHKYKPRLMNISNFIIKCVFRKGKANAGEKIQSY